jgi:hypothetical protein
MDTLRCIDCHKLFSPSAPETPVDSDHRWCFVRAFKANKTETVEGFYALCRTHIQEVPPKKVVRKTITIKGPAATMNIQQLWANRAAAAANKGKK